jgi:hypothetical protein
MPIIKINEKERLISSERMWVWQKLRIRKENLNKEQWDFYRNYTSLESAVLDLYNYGIRTSDKESLLDAVRDSKSSITKLIRDNTDFNKIFGEANERIY